MEPAVSPRVATTAALAAGLCLLAAALAAPARATPTTLSPAAEAVNSCVQRSNSLLVDIQIDRSASLRGTDPQDRRVDGIGAALLQLGRLADEDRPGGTSPRVEVLLSNFAGSVLPDAPGPAWRRVDRGSLEGLLNQAERYGDRDNGRDTDYVLAFAAARRALDARARTIAAATGVEPCKAILFLSDGRFHLGLRTGATTLPRSVFYAPGVDLGKPGGGAEAVSAGKDYLCRAGGLMDQIVDDGIVTFTVALSASSEFRVPDRAFLEAVTTGEGGADSCGTGLSPATGQFTEVSRTSDLFFAFDGPGEGDGGIRCAPPCPNPSQFVAGPGLSGFLLSASTPLKGVEVALTDPAGETENLSSTGPPSLYVSGATIEQHWIQSRSVEVEATFDPDSEEWQGLWRFRFFDPESTATPVPVYELSLRSDLRPAIRDGGKLVRGGSLPIELELVDGAGEPVTSGALVRLAQLRAEVRDSTGASRPVPVKETAPGRFALTIDVPKDAADGDWDLVVESSYPGSPTPVETARALLPLGAVVSPPGPPWWQLVAIVAALLAVLAVIALVLLNRRRREAGKFSSPLLLRGFRCEATVRPGAGVELEPDPVELRYEDFAPLRESGNDAKVAKLRYPPFTLRGRPARRLRDRPQGEVSADGAQLVGGRVGGPLSADEGQTRLRVPLELAGTWLFAIDSIDEEGTVRGRLAVITDVDAPSELGDRTLVAARSALAAQDWAGFRGARAVAADLDLGSGGEPVSTPDVDDLDWNSL